MKATQEEDLKEFDELTKDIENYMNYNSNSCQTLNASREIDFETKKVWKLLKDLTHHYKQDIERLWLVFRSFTSIALIINKGHYPCIITRGNNTFEVGNMWEGKIYGGLDFVAKVLKCDNYPEYKKLVVLIYFGLNEFLKIKVILFKVTEDNSTVLIWKVKYSTENPKSKMFENAKNFNDETLFEEVSKLLETSTLNLFQFESGIINAKMQDIWDIVTDSSKVDSIAPDNKCIVPSLNVNNFKAGDTLKVPLTIKDQKGTIDLKMDYLAKKKGWNQWMFSFSIIGADPFKIPNQTFITQLTKINENETQLSLCTKINEPITTESFRDLSKRKKYVLYSIKDYFDNFFSPDKNEQNENNKNNK